MNNMYIDFHAIQTVPPSCVNRDDTGSPKTAMYGGALRARVSSQAWKRAMRLMFKELFTTDMVGYRTKHVKELVKEKICASNAEIKEEQADKMAVNVLEIAKIKSNEDKKDTLFFISSLQAENLAKIAVDYDNDTITKKEKEKKYKPSIEKILNDNPSVDILLFGRMSASNPSLNLDAAAQVAHSISTHAISNEYDYFTAVDDYNVDDNTGAGHIGTVEFNSSTLYRYATVNIRELSQNLESDELIMAAKGFAEAFIRSMPTGKQNTFANRTLPNFVYVTLRKDQPINLSGAFEKPINAEDEGYVLKSEKELVKYADIVYKNYVTYPYKSWIVGNDYGDFAEMVNFSELLEKIQSEISQYSMEGE